MKRNGLARIVVHNLSSEEKKLVLSLAELSFPGVDILSLDYGSTCDLFVARPASPKDVFLFRNDYGRTKSLLLYSWRGCLCPSCGSSFSVSSSKKIDELLACPKCSAFFSCGEFFVSADQLLSSFSLPVGWSETSLFALPGQKSESDIRTFFSSFYDELSYFSRKNHQHGLRNAVSVLPSCPLIVELDEGLFGLPSKHKNERVCIFELICHIYSLAKKNRKGYSLLIKGDNRFSVWVSPDADSFCFSCKWTVAIGLVKLKINREYFSIFESQSPSSKELVCSVDTFLWKNAFEFSKGVVDSRLLGSTLFSISAFPDVARLRIEYEKIQAISALYSSPFSLDELPFSDSKSIDVLNAMFYCGLIETHF